MSFDFRPVFGYLNDTNIFQFLSEFCDKYSSHLENFFDAHSHEKAFIGLNDSKLRGKYDEYEFHDIVATLLSKDKCRGQSLKYFLRQTPSANVMTTMKVAFYFTYASERTARRFLDHLKYWNSNSPDLINTLYQRFEKLPLPDIIAKETKDLLCKRFPQTPNAPHATLTGTVSSGQEKHIGQKRNSR